MLPDHYVRGLMSGQVCPLTGNAGSDVPHLPFFLGEGGSSLVSFSPLSPRAPNPRFAGLTQGLGGVIVSVLNVVTLAVSSNNPTGAAFLFFILSVAVLVTCLG
jgi:hypothetical protein